MRNPRPCSRCNKKFVPTGKFCKLCDKCKDKAKEPFRVNKKNEI